MSLLYKPRQSTVPSKDGKKKWFPCLVKVGKPVHTEELAVRIAKMSSLSPGDVYSVLRNLVIVMNRDLTDSRSVYFDGLGSFTVVAHANGNGVDTPEEVNHSQINRLTIHFSPACRRQPGIGNKIPLLEGVHYEKLPSFRNKKHEKLEW